jgi:hypothetical protein
MKSKRYTVPDRTHLAALTFAAALLLASCQRPAFLDSELPDDGPPIQPTQEAALRFVEKVTDAGQAGVRSGQSALTVTQAEVTSFLNVGAQLAEQLQQFQNVETLDDLAQIENIKDLQVDGLGGETLRRWQQLAQKREGLSGLRLPDLSLRLSIQEPQVYFKGNGHIIVRGYGQMRSVRQPLRLVVAPRAREGKLVLDFVEGKLGPVPLPETLFDLIGKALSRAILAGQDYAEIQEITVTEGTLTLRGRYDKESLRSGLCVTC